MEVALLVRQTPGWANANAGVTRGPANAADFANFLTAARREFPDVDRWMIWGETNRVAVWDSGPVAYANLLDAAYGALKAPDLADPGDNTVVGGMTFTYGETAPANWIAQLKRSNGARPRLDEYGHNPFTRRCPDLAQGPNYLMDGARDISDLETLREDVRAAFGSYKPLWLSEFTVPSDRANKSFNWFVSRETQADWLSRAFRIAGHVPGVSGLGWFNLIDGAEPDGLTFGLLDTAYVKKPAYDVYKQATLADTGLPAPCGATTPPPPAPETPAPPVAAPPAAPQAPAPGDTRAPKVSLAAPRRVSRAALRKPLAFGVTSDEAGTAKATLSVVPNGKASPGRRARGEVVLARVSTAVAGRPVRMKARVPAGKRPLLARHKRAVLRLAVTVTDAAGNSTTGTAVIRLRP
jgi:hypothetical protein